MSKKPTVKELTERILEIEEDLKRAQADAVNIRRRSEQDKITIGTFAKRDVVTKLLPVIDNLDRAIKSTPEDLLKSEYVKGLVSVQKHLISTLSDMGVTKIKTLGEPYNPETMEAVVVEGESDKEVVTEELQAGYDLAEQNIRHAMVKIKRS